MLTHIAQTTPIIIPISSKFSMNPFRIIRLIWSRAKPEVIVQFRRNRHRFKIVKTTPIKLPVISGYSADSNFKRPTQNPAIDKLFKRFHSSSQTIKLIFEPKPCIQPEYPSIVLNSFYHFYSFTNSSCHWFLTPDVFTRFCSRPCYYPMPVRRSCNMNYIYIRPGNKFTEIVIA